MSRAELARQIYQVSYLQGTFKLRSGQVSHEYFDKYLFESDPGLLRATALHLTPLIPGDTKILAGLEMGGIPIATALSLETGLPLVMVRKKAKEYGTCKIAEGIACRGKKICVIEDVVTTGGQIILSARDLRQAGAEVEHVLCVILRNEEGRANLAKEGLTLIPLFGMEELKKA